MDLTQRVQQLKESGHPQARALTAVISDMGRLYSGIKASSEPLPAIDLPTWLVQALQANLHLSAESIAGPSQEEAQQLSADHWTSPKDQR